MANKNAEKIAELAKLIYASFIATQPEFDKQKARLAAISSFESAKIFYEYANDRNYPK